MTDSTSPSRSTRPHAPKRANSVLLHPVNALLVVTAFVASFWSFGLFAGTADASDSLIAIIAPMLVIVLGIAGAGAVRFVTGTSHTASVITLGVMLCGFIGLLVTSPPPTRISSYPFPRAAAPVDPMPRLRADAAYKRASERYIEQVESASASVAEAIQFAVAAGGTDPGTLTSLELIESRLALLTNLQQENRRSCDLLTDQRAVFHALLVTEGCPTDLEQQLTDQFLAEAASERSAEICRRRTRTIEATHAFLTFLRDHWGSYAVDRQGFTFDTHELLNTFVTMQKELLEASDHEMALYRQESGGQ
jgi:hypothetical protein